VVRQLRGLELKKPPSIAESIDWAASLLWLGKEDLDVETTLQTLTTVVKYREDQEKLERIIYRDRDLNFRA